MTCRVADFDEQPPVHQLGQYNAWGLPDDPRLPGDMIWISRADCFAPAAHRVLPHGEPSLAIRRLRDRTGEIVSCDLVTCGPFRTPLWYRPTPAEELIAVRLKPETAADLFGVDPVEHYDAPMAPAPRRVKLALAAELEFAWTGACTQIAARLAKGICRASVHYHVADGPERAAAIILRRSNGAWRTKHLAEHLEVSERNLRRRFIERMGCSPKAYSRQLRLTAIMQAAEREQRPRWADLAAAYGFHDQAHMINEFQAMVRMTPQEIHAERRSLSAFSNTNAPR